MKQGDCHGAKIIATNLRPNQRRPTADGLGGMSFDLAQRVILVLLEKEDVADGAHGFDPGYFVQSLPGPLVIISHAGRRSGVRIGKLHFHRE